MTYIYGADVWCDDCAKNICQTISDRGEAPDDPDNQRSYDSSQYPKFVGDTGDTGESDSPEHCGAGEACINAIELTDKSKIGVWLENELTLDGIEYVKEAVREGGEVAALWASWYDWIDFDDPPTPLTNLQYYANYPVNWNDSDGSAADDAWDHCKELEEALASVKLEAQAIDAPPNTDAIEKQEREVVAAFANWDALYGVQRQNLAENLFSACCPLLAARNQKG